MAVDWSSVVLGPVVGVFGETCLYIIDNDSFTITGVFDEAYIEVTPLGRGGMVDTEGFALGSPGSITGARPVLGVQLSQFQPWQQPQQGHAIQIRGAMYYVKEVQTDSHGGAKLLLNQWREADPYAG